MAKSAFDLDALIDRKVEERVEARLAAHFEASEKPKTARKSTKAEKPAPKTPTPAVYNVERMAGDKGEYILISKTFSNGFTKGLGIPSDGDALEQIVTVGASLLSEDARLNVMIAVADSLGFDLSVSGDPETA